MTIRTPTRYPLGDPIGYTTCRHAPHRTVSRSSDKAQKKETFRIKNGVKWRGPANWNLRSDKCYAKVPIFLHNLIIFGRGFHFVNGLLAPKLIKPRKTL